MLSALLTVSTSFNSCKDYDDERIDAYENGHQTHVQTMKDAINDSITNAWKEFANGSHLKDAKGNDAWKDFIMDYVNKSTIDFSDGTAANLKKYLGDNGYDTSENIVNSINAQLYSGEKFSGAVQHYLDSIGYNTFNIGDYFALDENNKPVILSQYANLETLVDSIIKAGKAKDIRIDSVARENLLVNLRVDSVAAKTKAIEADIVNLKTDISNILAAMKSQVTGVIAQATENPVVGSFALPIGIQSNILAGYYGTAENACESFPIGAIDLIDQSEAFTSDEKNVIGKLSNEVSWSAGDTLGADGNAGTVYVTVNPSTVSFTGKRLSLVNSNDESAGIELSPLAKSDKTLKFGATRADNGFYEATAKLVDPTKAKISFNGADIKGVAKDILSYSDGINFTNAALQIYKAVSNLGDAYALKATYTDTLGEHSVYSNYNIGAYAINPLSYAFLKDSKYNNLGRIPTIPSQLTLETLGLGDFKIDNVEFPEITGIDEMVTAKLHLPDDAVNTDRKTVEIPTGATATYDYDIDGSGHVEGATSIPEGAKNIVTHVTLSDGGKVIFRNLKKDDEGWYIEAQCSVKEIVDKLKDYSSDVNTKLQDMIDNINGKIQGLEDNKVFATYNKYASKVNTLINKLNGALSDVNAKLQPMLVADLNGEFVAVSNTKGIGNPVKFSLGAGVPLYLTSYTAELLAPAYKKYIAVVDAKKNGTSTSDPSKAQDANKNSCNFNKVLEGNEYRAGFTGEAGYTYTIAYACADYNGKVTIKRFYITVNE